MRLLKYFFAVIWLSFSLIGCKGTNGEPIITNPEVTLSATPISFSIGEQGDTVDIAITSNTTWAISGNNDWCRTNISKSKDNATVKLFVAANDVEEARSNSLTLSATGATDIIITVLQAAKVVVPEEQEPVKPVYIASDPTGMHTELTAIEFSKLLGVGWNLGNSLEAISVNNGIYSGNESTWGNPVTSQQLIDSVKAAGFNVIRIPISYSHMLEDQTSYKIKWSWKQRIEEVVKYATDHDMYAMINIHWDGGWMNHPDNAHKVAINAKIDSLWKQIAIYFRDFDDHLIFAGTNEVGMENTYGNPTAEYAAVQNSFNQTFVNTVRATGGRNTYRFLAVQSYFTNIDYAVNYMVIPTDATIDRLMAEVHYYDPWEFCIKTDPPYVTVWSEATWGKEDWVDTQFGNMKSTFVDFGIPVLVGEYGVTYRTSLSGIALENHNNSRNYYLHYVTGRALTDGMVPFYWDNGAPGGALFNRSTGKAENIGALNAIISAKGTKK